jgi:hypothetical protein
LNARMREILRRQERQFKKAWGSDPAILKANTGEMG